MNPVKIVGFIAGALTTIAFIPQVVKTYQSKSAKGLSLGMFGIYWLGTICWLSYGILIQDFPVITANTVSVVLASTLLFFKFRYKD